MTSESSPISITLSFWPASAGFAFFSFGIEGRGSSAPVLGVGGPEAGLSPLLSAALLVFLPPGPPTGIDNHPLRPRELFPPMSEEKKEKKKKRKEKRKSVTYPGPTVTVTGGNFEKTRRTPSPADGRAASEPASESPVPARGRPGQPRHLLNSVT